MDIEVLTGPQGGGKSTIMRQEAIDNPGLYLFACPTIELIEEQSDAFHQIAPSLTIVKVHQDSGTGAVARRLTEACRDFNARNLKHGVIFITHETLISHSLEGFDGWHARIDEAPSAVQAGRLNIGVSTRSWLEATYELVCRVGSEWSALRLKVDKPDWTAVQRDSGAKALSEFIKQAAQPDRVFVKTTSWDAKDDIEWFSMWTPLSLPQFASVKIAGSSYLASIGYRAACAIFNDKINFTERRIEPLRQGQPKISIHYFTRGHEGSTTFWDTYEGGGWIKQVRVYLERRLPESGYWSGNIVVRKFLQHDLKGTQIKPMAAGLNKHRDARDCALIFSAKETPDDRSIKSVFDLTGDDIRQAREDDVVAQFVMRGAIRDLSYDGPYAIYLYSESQANRLKDHLIRCAFSNVETIPLDEAGFMDAKRSVKKKRDPTPEEREIKDEHRREEARKRSQRNRDKKKADEALSL